MIAHSDVVPLWGLFALTVAFVILAIELGLQLGRYRRRTTPDEKEGPVGAIVGAMLGLLGFILAFTFGMAASRFDARRTIVVDEANAIGTCYLRAGLLPENGDDVRAILRRYVDSRIEAARTGLLERAIEVADTSHQALWKLAEANGRKYPASIAVGLFIQSLNDTIDIHATRILAGLQGRIPPILWSTIYLVTILTMSAVGYLAGLSGSRRSLTSFILATTFSAILMLVADLDRSREGMIEVSQQAMIDLQAMMMSRN